MKITIRNILKIKRHQYFDSSIKNHKTINNMLRRKVMITMFSAYKIGSEFEVLTIVDNHSFKHKTFTDKRTDMVSIPDSIKDYLENGSYTAIHNHPSNGNFSIEDLTTFIQWVNIHYLFVCTNDCKYIAVLGKSVTINGKLQNQMLYVINEYKIKKHVDDHYSALELIEFFCTKGLLYQVRKNY